MHCDEHVRYSDVPSLLGMRAPENDRKLTVSGRCRNSSEDDTSWSAQTGSDVGTYPQAAFTEKD